MSFIQFDLPWIVAVLGCALAVMGLIYLVRLSWQGIRFVGFLMRGGLLPPKEESIPEESTQDTDKRVQALLKARIREVWYSFSPVQWLDLKILQKDCHSLVKEIAGVYFPDSTQPDLEVSILELLQFNERTAHRIRNLLEEIPSFHRLTVASILDAKSLLEKTKQTIDKKGIKTGRRFASRIWTAVNAVNPNYWIQRFLFRGASEVIGRKVLTSVYRIVGVEAIRLYSASAVHTVQAPILEEELLNSDSPEETIQENQTNETCKDEHSNLEPENRKDTKKDKEMTDDQEWILPDEDQKEEQEESQEEPEKLSSSISKMLSNFVEGSMHIWDKMVSADKVIASFQKHDESVQCLSDIQTLPVETIDPIADAYIRKGRWATAAEGAATGFGGFLLLSADAVSLLALQLRTIQQIGYCYGFDVSRPEEKLFAAKLLAEAYNHPAGKEKDAIKKEMRMAAGLLQGKTPFGLLQKRLFVQGFSKIAQKMGVRFGSRKAAQFVPVLGSAVGGIINQQVTKDIATTAKEVYRDRFLEKEKFTS